MTSPNLQSNSQPNLQLEPEKLTMQSVSLARQSSAKDGRRALEILEQISGESPADFTRQLAVIFSYTPITLGEMLALRPAFERLSFSESLQHECVLLNDEDNLILVFADVYADDLHAWASERIAASFVAKLAHHADIAAYLSQHEDSMRTVGSALSGVAKSGYVASEIEELSLNVIEGDASPVVKLVRSTLYDALKAEASDIHMETAPTGLVIK